MQSLKSLKVYVSQVSGYIRGGGGHDYLQCKEPVLRCGAPKAGAEQRGLRQEPGSPQNPA